MKYLFFVVFAMMFTITAKAEVMFLGSRAQVLNLVPVASVNTSGDSSAIDLQGYSGNCAAIIDAAKASGDGSTALDLKLKDSATSGGAYTDISGGSFTQVTSSPTVAKVVFNKDKVKRYVKLERTLAGGSGPAYLLSAKILCDKKYR